MALLAITNQTLCHETAAARGQNSGVSRTAPTGFQLLDQRRVTWSLPCCVFGLHSVLSCGPRSHGCLKLFGCIPDEINSDHPAPSMSSGCFCFVLFLNAVLSIIQTNAHTKSVQLTNPHKVHIHVSKHSGKERDGATPKGPLRAPCQAPPTAGKSPRRDSNIICLFFLLDLTSLLNAFVRFPLWLLVAGGCSFTLPWNIPSCELTTTYLSFPPPMGA